MGWGESMNVSNICSLSRAPRVARPPDFCRLRNDGSCRPAPGLAQSGRKRRRETFFFVGPEEGGDRQPSAVRNKEQALDAELLVHVAIEPHPNRIEGPF